MSKVSKDVWKNQSKFATNEQLSYCIARKTHKSSPCSMELWQPEFADDRPIRDQVYTKRDLQLKYVKDVADRYN